MSFNSNLTKPKAQMCVQCTHWMYIPRKIGTKEQENVKALMAA